MQALVEASPVLGNAFRKAKRAMRGHGDDIEAALRELNRLESERQKVIAERNTHRARFRTYTKQCAGKFSASPTLENEIALRIAEIVVKDDDSRNPRPALPMQYATIFGDYGESDAVWKEFVKREPNWQKALTALSGARLAVAEKECDEIDAKVRADFAAAGFGNEEADADPRIKRAKRRVERAERLEAKAQDATSYRDWASLHKDLTDIDE
jgi:hypothetical protein